MESASTITASGGSGQKAHPETAWRKALVILVAAMLAAVGVGGGVAPASAAPPCDISWAGGASGSWTTAANWSPVRVPTSSDNVCIAGAATVTATSSISIKSLALGGPAGASELTLGTASLTLAGDSTIDDGGELIAGGITVSGGTLTNDGVLKTTTGHTTTVAGNVTNAADGLLDIVNGSTLAVDGPGTFINEGELIVRAGSQLAAQPTSPTTAVIDNAGGRIDLDGGSSSIQSGATFVQGAGVVAGEPSNLGVALDVNGGTLDLEGNGEASFIVVNGSLEGTVAPSQLVELNGTNTTAGQLANSGAIVVVGGGTFTVASDDTLTNGGTLAAKAGFTLVGNVNNLAGGTIAVPSTQLVLRPPYDLVNDGTIAIGPNGAVLAENGGPATIDNDGGTIAAGFPVSGGFKFSLQSGTTFIEGGGATTGQPIQAGGALEIDGTGAANLAATGGSTISGDIAAAQTVVLSGTVTAAGSFTNNGTLTGTGHLVLPAGDGIVNDGTLGLTGNLTLDGNLTNGPAGLLDLNNFQLVGASGTTVSNEGTLDMVNSSIVLSAGIEFDNSGLIEFALIGGSWGGFGLHSIIQVDGPGPAHIHLGGAIEPVFPQGNPPTNVTLPPVWVSGNGGQISYGVASVPTAFQGDPLNDVTCGASVGGGFSLGCSDTGGQAITIFDNAPGEDPTQVTVGSSAPSISGPCGTQACPTSSYGQPVTLTATVAASYPGSPAPTGSVTFFDGAVALGTGTLSTSNGFTTATLTTSDLPPGSHQIMVLYGGDASSLGGNSASLQEYVEPVTTTVAVTSSPDPSSLGQPVTLTATVTPAGLGPASPTGELLFFSGSNVLGAASVSTSAAVTTGSFTTTSLPAGPSSVTASYSGDFNYASSVSPSAGVTVNAPSAPSTVTVAGPGTVDPGTAYSASVITDGTAPSLFALAGDPAANSGLAIDPGTGSVGYSVPLSGVTSFSYAVVALNAAGRAESALQTVLVRSPQTIAFTSASPSGVTVGGTYTPTATSTSGLAVAIAIDSASGSACTSAGGAVSFNHTGTCVIDADQSGNANFLAAAEQQQSVTVGKASQTVSFTSTAPASATAGGPTYTPTAVSTSGLAVAIALDSSSSGCTLGGGTVTFTAAGSCVIHADQAGNGDYLTAAEERQTVIVTAAAKTPQTITYTSVPPAGPTIGGTYSLSAKGGGSGSPVIFSIDSSSSSGACSLSGATVTFTGAGSCVIDANQAGNGAYLPAPQVQQHLTVRVTASGIAALTLAFVRSSARYQSLNSLQKAVLSTEVELLSIVLEPVGAGLLRPLDAALVRVYEAGIASVEAGGFLSPGQAVTLDKAAVEL